MRCTLALLALSALGCSAAGSHEADDFTPTGTCEHVLEAPEPSPELGELTAPFGAQYADRLVHEILISDALPADNQEAAIQALDALRSLTGGWVSLTPMIGHTECEQPWALHAAPQGDCSLTMSSRGARVGWTFGFPFRFVVRSQAAEGWAPSSEETYITTLHESLHVLGLPHGSGIMSPGLQSMTACPEVSAKQLRSVADQHNWPRDAMVVGSYPYGVVD